MIAGAACPDESDFLELLRAVEFSTNYIHVRAVVERMRGPTLVSPHVGDSDGKFEDVECGI